MYNVSMPGRFGRMTGACLLAGAMMIGGTGVSVAQPSNDLVRNIQINGSATDSDSGTTSNLTGSLTLTGIFFDASTTDTLILSGNFSGQAVAMDGTTTSVLGQVFTTTGTITAIGGQKNKCGLVNMDLSTLDFNLVNMTAEVEDITIDVATASGKSRNLGNQLCKLSRFIQKIDRNQVNKVVAKINSLITTPLTNVPVGGSAEGGTFNGFLTVEGVSVDPNGQIFLNGIINGVVAGDGGTTVVAGSAFNTSASLTQASLGFEGKFDTLIINFGTIELSTPDVDIELADVHVPLGAAAGSSKKLIKTFGSIAKTLDKQAVKPTETFKLVKKLTKLAGKANQLLLSV